MTIANPMVRKPTDEQTFRLHNSVVPKELRARALALVKKMPKGEVRNHAFQWVRGSMRTADQIQRFIDKMMGAA